MVKVRAARSATVLVLTSALVASACGGGGDGSDAAGRPEGFEASRAYLARAVVASRRAPHRFEARLSLGQPGSADDAPVVRGDSDGHWTYSRSDARSAVEASGQELPFDPDTIDWVTETVTDGHTFYMRAPFIADVAAARPENVPPVVGVLQGLGDKWGQVDLTALGDPVPATVGKWLPGTRELGVRQALELVLTAHTVEDGGSTTVDGETLSRLTADVAFEDLLVAEGIDVTSALASPDTPPGLANVMRNAELKAQLLIDRDGHVRRLIVDTGSTFEKIADEVGEKGVPDGFKIQGVFTFSDYGDRSIAVALPTEPVDITAPLRELTKPQP
jgi:hypothetical protein